MNSSINIILKRDKAPENGPIPLYIRITRGHISRYMSLGIRVPENKWDNALQRIHTSHPNHQWLNARISQKYAEAERAALELEQKQLPADPEKIMERIRSDSHTNFFPFAARCLGRYEKAEQIGTYLRAKTVVNKLRSYHGNDNLAFEQITVGFLNEYETYLRHRLRNSVNTVHSNMRVIRKIIYDAIREDLISPAQNPFIKMRLKTERTERTFLTEDELKRLEALDLKGRGLLYHHRNLYVFAAYTGGLRISDVLLLKWKDFDGERIHVQMAKTRKSVVIKVPNKGLEILRLYGDCHSQHGDFVFPGLGKNHSSLSRHLQLKAISSRNAVINKNLKQLARMAGISKRLTFHSSRHTFATLALRKGMKVQYVSRLLGHSDLATTMLYARIIDEDLENAMAIFDQ